MPKIIKKEEIPISAQITSNKEKLESAMEITAEKLNKAYTKQANLQADIDSMELSMDLLKRELEECQD